MLTKKVKLLTKQPKQPQTLKCVCSRPMTPGKGIIPCGSHTHLNMNVSVFVCCSPIGTLSPLMGGGAWLWGSEMWSSSWALLCRGLQYHCVLGTCANGLGSPYYYCAQQAYPPCTYKTPGPHHHHPPPHLLNLSVWFSLRQITCWSGGAHGSQQWDGGVWWGGRCRGLAMREEWCCLLVQPLWWFGHKGPTTSVCSETPWKVSSSCFI